MVIASALSKVLNGCGMQYINNCGIFLWKYCTKKKKVTFFNARKTGVMEVGGVGWGGGGGL